MKSALTDNQSEEMSVTRRLDGVLVIRGLIATAANTSVSAEFGFSRRSYHEMLMLPELSGFLSAGIKWNEPNTVSLLSLIGAKLVGVSEGPKLKVWSRMSPPGLLRASFQTTLTVPANSLTAMRGKSFIGKRLYPGIIARSIDTIGIDLVDCDGHVVVVGNVRHIRGMRASLLTTGVEVSAHAATEKFVTQL